MTRSDTNSPPPGRGIQPLDSLHNHSHMVVLIFLIVALLGVPVVFIKGTPSYEASATVQVSPRYMKTLHDDIELEFQSNTQYLQFIFQQARTVNRYDVLELALQRLVQTGENHWSRDGESIRKAVERLQRSLDIRHVRNTYLIQISLVTAEPDGIDATLNAVVAAYLERAKEEDFYAADQRVDNLKDRENELLERIGSMTTDRTQIAEKLGVTAFNPNEVNPFDRRTRQLQEKHQQARTQRMQAQARLDAFLEEGETDTTMRSVQETVLSDPGLNSLRASLNQRRAELLTTTSGLSLQHPAYLDAQDELRRIEQEISSSQIVLRDSLKQGIESSHRTSTAQASTIESQLEQMLIEISQQAADYAENFNRAVSLTNHLNLLWKELDRVRDRLNFFEVEQASPGFLRMVTPALPPLYPTGVGKKKLVLMILIAAAVSSLITPILIDLLDRRVRTVNDAHRALGFPPLSWIVDGADSDRVSFAEDQLRRLASGIVREGTRNGTRIIVISSVRPGGGTTWIARSLTRTLNSIGFPTVVVEANAYHPNPVYGKGPGLRSLLENGIDRLHINTNEPDIPSVPVGDSDNSQGLRNLQSIRTMLNAIPECYRFVIIDAPPLLASSDAELVAGAGDAVLLVAEAGCILQGELTRAGRLLSSIDPPVVGAVVNRIKPFHGSGYVTALAKEHRSGHKVQPASPVHALLSTLTRLVLAPFAMVRDLMYAPAFQSRHRHSSETEQNREES